MKNGKRIFIYTEDAPVHRDVVACGLNRAGAPILRSIRDHIDGIAIYPIRQRYDGDELDLQLAPLCRNLPPLPTLICKAFRRFPALDFGVADALPPLMFARMVRRSTADILFSFVGADPGILTRASKLADLAGKSCVFYVVDDFLSTMRIVGADVETLRRVRERARTVLRAAKHVFAITEGLGEHLRESYGVSPTMLNLAFEVEPRPLLPAKKQIIYLGSINFLYAEGLRELFRSVERVRRCSGAELTVRLTVPAELAARELGTLPHFVVSAPVETSEGLAQEIASSLFAFLPYSFNSREKAMVTTSFPSKSMEYLAYARAIVVYGPEYGAATRVFRKMGLPSVVLSPMELEGAVRSHLAAWPEHSAVYRNYLLEAHSSAAVRSVICAALGLAN